MLEARRLAGLRGIGPAMLKDFEVLGIRTVSELALREPQEMYERLCARTGVRHDPCVLDTFACAAAQARDPMLPRKKADWWYWAGVRKRDRLHGGTSGAVSASGDVP